MKFKVTRMHVLLFFEAWWLMFIAMSETSLRSSSLFTVVSLASLFLVPGFLTILIVRLRGLDLWTYLLLALGISILESICIALCGNTILPYFGIADPLGTSVLTFELSIFVAALIAASWIRVETSHLTIPRFILTDSLRDLFLALVPVLCVVASIVGATLLNNGASGSVTFLMLVAAALYSAALLYTSRTAHENVIPTGLFFLSLAFLFMTSLRGWYITGHDIQREYEVFQLTKNAGLWSISFLRDAYNACLSITILPSMVSALSNIADPYIFKAVFQIIFATVPTMLFLFVRRYVSSTIALMTALYFIAFPTFFTDMPFLNRQEIAFVFLFLMFLIITDERISLTARRVLFCTFGLGMVLSHYSTTYTVVILLLMSTIMHPFATWAARLVPRIMNAKIFAHSGLALFTKEAQRPRITFLMALLLACASFLWSSVLTDTSSNSIYRVVAETFSVIHKNAGDDARSSAVLYGLFSFTHVEPAELLAGYDTKVAAPERSLEPQSYFPDSVLAHYPVLPAHEALLPLSPLGSALSSSGVNVAAFNTFVRQSSAKILQLLMLIGIGAVVFSRRHLLKRLDTEFVLLSLGSVSMLCAIMVLPVLSVEYGILRAFQQSLLFLGLFIVIGNLALLSKAGEKIALASSCTLVVLFMLSSTGVITQTLGAYEPQLHLNNAGTYYDLYYVTRSEIAGTTWLLSEMRARNVSGYQSGLGVDVTPYLPNDLTDGVEVGKNVYPGLIRKQSFVLLGPSILHGARANVLYNSDVVTYQYPLDFLDENKNLIYSNGDVAVYR